MQVGVNLGAQVLWQLDSLVVVNELQDILF